jgi:hypothetical protein
VLPYLKGILINKVWAFLNILFVIHQATPHGYDHQAYCPLWLKDMGLAFVVEQLDQDQESPNHSPHAHHPMQVYDSPTHCLGNVRSSLFLLEVILRVVSFLHRVRTFRDFTSERDKCPYLAFFLPRPSPQPAPQRILTCGP